MKTAGIVGGVGPESTIDYYRLIIECFHEKTPDGSSPRLLIASVDMKRMLELLSDGRSGELAAFFLAEVEALARAGADFALFASNTPHVVLGEISRSSPIPILGITAPARKAAAAMGLTRVGLLGTRFTMRGSFYQEEFQRAGIQVVVPPEPDQAYIHEKYLGEIANGIILQETRAGLLEIVERMKSAEGIDGLILGGTELPLILCGIGDQGIPFLDTTELHVKETVEMILS